MANMVYCTMQVEAPDQRQLTDFIINKTNTNPADIVDVSFFKFSFDEEFVPIVDNFTYEQNKITMQFQTKWTPPSKEIKAIANQYKNLIFKMEACEEFNDFVYEFSSDPNNYFETFRKLSNEEIEKLEENNVDIGGLIKKLALLDNDTLQYVLEEVEEYKATKLIIQNKYDYIKNNIKNLNDRQINSIYNILKPKPKVVIEDDDDEDWM